MGNIQRIVLVLGTALTIYFLAFAPFNYSVTIKNPEYVAPTSKWISTKPELVTQQRVDYWRRLSFAGASILGTGALFLVVKPKKEEKDGRISESD